MKSTGSIGAFRAGAFLATSIMLWTGLAPRAVAGDNPVILQWFENRWEDVERRSPDFFLGGYGAVWMPPPSKGASSGSAGYDVFDRFDLGRAFSETAFGTEDEFKAMIDELHQADGQVFIDLIMNHNSPRRIDTTFQIEGGYPGFWMEPASPPVTKQPTDAWGDFHFGNSLGYYQSEDPSGFNYDLERGDLVGLIDIAQETNHRFIRHPVDPADPMNIPPGTIRNRPDPSNARFYPDLDLPGFTFWNPGAHGHAAQQFTFHPFNTSDPLQGDPTPDNTTGLLMRFTQWLMDEFHVDGFRLDAAKHVPNWFWDIFWDSTVYLRRTTPDGRQVTPLSFVESVESNSFTFNNFVRKSDGFGNRDALDLNGAGKLRDLINAGGFGSWSNVFDAEGGHIDTIDDGFQNGSVGILHVFSHDNGSTGDGASSPPLPTDRQMGLFTQAYILMRPGRPIMYYNAKGITRGFGFFPKEGLPIALGLNPGTGALDDRITRLVQIHNEVARGQYFPLNSTDPGNPSISDVLIFERASPIGGGQKVGNALIGVNDRYDVGVQTRNVLTSFAPGTRLHELTGNADDARVDPGGLVPNTLVVDSSGRVSITVPNNRSAAGESNGGYVVYAPALPTGTLQVVGTSGVIGADPSSAPSWFRRLNDVPVLNADTFRIELTTTQTDPLDPSTDDDALFKIDQGFVDYNGNGTVDIPASDLVLGGYERFASVFQPLFGSGSTQGRYEQTIDATMLSEGFHYISVVALRHRSAGSPLFREFRRVIYVDRAGPIVTLDDAGVDITETNHEIVIRAVDRTTNRVHVFLDLDPGVDPIPLADPFNAASRRDRFEWRKTLVGLTHGPHRLTLVPFEQTDNASVIDFAIFVNLFPADVDRDGDADVADFFAFVVAFAAGDPAADINGDGRVDVGDFFAFVSAFSAGCS